MSLLNSTLKNTECSICFSKHINSNNKISCNKCQKVICKKCLSESLKVARDETPHCPSCKESFTKESLNSMFTKHFRKNVLHKFQIKQLIEKEKTFFPDTINIVEKENAYCEFIKLYAYHAQLTRKISPTDTDVLELSLFENINEIRLKMKALKEKIQRLSSSSFSNINKKCQNCENGYLNLEWTCQLCNYKTCQQCLKSIHHNDDEHVCSEDDIASKNIIDKITKSCPHCFTQVEKSQGCNQMWCTACNRAFNWDTGNKINGPIHNPHYNEFLQKKEHDLLHSCSDDNSWPWHNKYHLLRFINPFISDKLTSNEENLLICICNCMISLSRSRYQEYSQALYEPLRKLRIRGKLNDVQWEKALSKKEYRRERNLRIKKLNDLMILITRDLFLELGRGPLISLNEFKTTTLQSLENLRLYYNDEIKNIYDDFGCKPRKISETTWSLL